MDLKVLEYLRLRVSCKIRTQNRLKFTLKIKFESKFRIEIRMSCKIRPLDLNMFPLEPILK